MYVATLIGVGGLLFKEPLRSLTIGGICNATQSRGFVKLNSADPHDHPIIDLGLGNDPSTVERLVEVLKLTLKLVEQKQFKDIGFKITFPPQKLTTDQEIEAHVKETAFPPWHPAGSCEYQKQKFLFLNLSLCVYR